RVRPRGLELHLRDDRPGRQLDREPPRRGGHRLRRLRPGRDDRGPDLPRHRRPLQPLRRAAAARRPHEPGAAGLEPGLPGREELSLSYLTTPDGTRLRYTDRGAGERTIVLVHGWKGSHRLWDPAVIRLAERFRVVAFDNRGMGESDKPGGPYDFDVLADDLGFVLEELGVEDATLVGWSMGCSISLQYLERGGGRVGRLVLVNGPIV